MCFSSSNRQLLILLERVNASAPGNRTFFFLDTLRPVGVKWQTSDKRAGNKEESLSRISVLFTQILSPKDKRNQIYLDIING